MLLERDFFRGGGKVACPRDATLPSRRSATANVRSPAAPRPEPTDSEVEACHLAQRTEEGRDTLAACGRVGGGHGLGQLIGVPHDGEARRQLLAQVLGADTREEDFRVARPSSAACWRMFRG